MASKLERFTQRARRVLHLAQEAAEGWKHNYIGTEHLIAGFVREETGIAGRVLRSLGATEENVTQFVERMTGAGTATSLGSKLDLTPRTKQVIEYAIDEARKLGHNYISTEHLLLGLIRQGDGVAIDVLRQLGLTADKVRREVLRLIQQEAEPDEASHPSGTTLSAVAQIFSEDDPDMIFKLEEFAKFLLWQKRMKQSK